MTGRRTLVLTVLAALALFALPGGSARAQYYYRGGYYRPYYRGGYYRPYYYGPRIGVGVYVAPAPVFVAPAPVYAVPPPPPVYVQPVPAVPPR